MKWTVETSSMFTGLMNVYDEDGNSIARDNISEHARLIAAAPVLAECLQEAVDLVYSAYSDTNKGLADMDTEKWRDALAQAGDE